jgi:hypothetical protein
MPVHQHPQTDARAAARSDDGHVYLVECGGLYRIGRCVQNGPRTGEVRLSLPRKAGLVHCIRTDDPPGIEAYWHRRFADRRVDRDWFLLSPADVAAFRRRRFQ